MNFYFYSGFNRKWRNEFGVWYCWIEFLSFKINKEISDDDVDDDKNSNNDEWVNKMLYLIFYKKWIWINFK